MVNITKDIERLYCDTCNIYEYKEYTEGSVTKHKEELKHKNIKCRISFSTGRIFNRLSSGEEKEDFLKLKQNIKLFLPAKIEVKAGSKIEVTHQGHTMVFVNSSIGAVYKSHTEILLDNNKEWA